MTDTFGALRSSMRRTCWGVKLPPRRFRIAATASGRVDSLSTASTLSSGVLRVEVCLPFETAAGAAVLVGSGALSGTRCGCSADRSFAARRQIDASGPRRALAVEARPHRGKIVENLAHERRRATDLDLAIAVTEAQRVRHRRGGNLHPGRRAEGRPRVVVVVGPGTGELPGAGERGTVRRGASLIWAVVRHWSPGCLRVRRGCDRGSGCRAGWVRRPRGYRRHPPRGRARPGPATPW